MSLHLSKDEETNYYFLGKMYNVEYELSNGRCYTFSNILENVDGKYFWFCSKERGMDIIRQDRVVTMVCINRKC